MRRAEDRTPDVIRRMVSGAKKSVDKVGNLLSDGFWKARKMAARAGEKVKDVGQKIEDSA